MEKGKILQSILFHNPFDTYGKEHLTHIKRYYQIAPALMLAFLLYGAGQFRHVGKALFHRASCCCFHSMSGKIGV